MTNNFKKKKNHIHGKEKTKINMLKLVAFTLISIFLAVLIIFFVKNNDKSIKIIKVGKNSSSQEIVDYVLNINSYETEIDVEVKSNKNSNKYKIKQKYKSNEYNEQEVLEPSNIQGVKIIKNRNNLNIENSRLSITKIIEGYCEITQNNLDLSSFIENYKKNPNSEFIEEENQIIMSTTVQNETTYQKYEKLYVSKENGKPTKMEIEDTNQNLIIYIIYNKIELYL